MGQLTKVSADLVKKVQRLPPSCLKRDWPFFCANFPKLCNCAKLYGSIDYKRKQYVKVYIHILGRTKYLKKNLKIFQKYWEIFFLILVAFSEYLNCMCLENHGCQGF